MSTDLNRIEEDSSGSACHISLDIKTKTWDMKEQERINAFNLFLKSEPAENEFDVEESNYYASVLIKKKDMDHTQCGISAGIHGGITVGQGKLDHNGYWEKPCYICARKLEKEHPEDYPVWPFEGTK